MHDLHVEYEWSLADECTASRVSAYDYAATCCPNCRQPRPVADHPRNTHWSTLETGEKVHAMKIYLSIYLYEKTKLFVSRCGDYSGDERGHFFALVSKYYFCVDLWNVIGE